MQVQPVYFWQCAVDSYPCPPLKINLEKLFISLFAFTRLEHQKFIEKIKIEKYASKIRPRKLPGLLPNRSVL